MASSVNSSVNIVTGVAGFVGGSLLYQGLVSAGVGFVPRTIIVVAIAVIAIVAVWLRRRRTSTPEPGNPVAPIDADK